MTVATTATTTNISIPAGRPKSGRVWKAMRVVRSSAQTRKGVLSHLSKTFEERNVIRQKNRNIKDIEKEMIENRKQRKRDSRARTEELRKIRMENEYKNSQYQVLKPEKLKSMNKKQLRAVKKTSMNQNGQIELVNPWGNKSSALPSKKQKRK